MLDSNWNTYLSKVIIHFTDSLDFEITGEDKILQVSLKEELSNNTANPIGVVSANTISIKFIDTEKLFGRNNTASEYYGYAKEGLKLEYFISLDGGPFNRAGVYYITNFEVDTSNHIYNVVNVNAADMIQYLGNEPIKDVMIEEGSTVKDYLKSVLKGLGLNDSEINISETLDKPLKYNYSVGAKYKDILNSICQSYLCNIFIDRDGVVNCIDLVDRALETNYEMQFDSETNIFSTSIGDELLSNYNAVKVNFIEPTIGESEEVHKIENLEVGSGENVISRIVLPQDKKLNMVDYVAVINQEGDSKVEVSDITTYQSAIDLTLYNHGNACKVNVTIYGFFLYDNKTYIELVKEGIDRKNIKFLEVNTDLIQDREYANQYASFILNYISHDMAYIKLRAKGNPLLGLGEVCSISSDVLDIDVLGILASSNISVSGGYSQELMFINCEAINDSAGQ